MWERFNNRIVRFLKRKKKENRLRELAFLRSQISPHFIFNVLNSTVSMARTGSGHLEPVLTGLSSLLRYMLYAAGDEKIPLAREAEYVEIYLDLQKIRFGEDVHITFSHEGDLMGSGIEPMLLLPLVENAFKHGIGDIDNPGIFIEMKESNGIFNFQVKNKINSSIKKTQDKNSGIGLANVRKRLELLYHHKHDLKTTVSAGWFHVQLNMQVR